MSNAPKRTVFLSTRPPVELPFAAEITLQVCDRALKGHGFSHVEITNNPMASYRWHHDYENFRLRWLSKDQNTRIETVGLVWIHEPEEEAGLAVCLQGRIDKSGNVGLGTFQALKIGMYSRVGNSETWFEDCIMRFAQDKNVPRTIPESALEAECTVELEDSVLDVSAFLEQQDIFGNEVYTLTINIHGQRFRRPLE